VALSNEKMTLPVQVASRVDVGRLLREVGELRNFLKQAAIREPGTSIKLPKTSRLLDETVTSNKLNALIDADCARLETFLENIKSTAPILHMSFSSDPSPQFIQRLMAYLRKEIHPQVLLQIGLQPSIGAGCIVRTKNKYFDFSLRQRFEQQRELLLQKIKAIEQMPSRVVPNSTEGKPT